MPRMNGDRPVETAPTSLTQLLSRDMEIVTGTTLPVLISAPPDSALELAIGIALGGGVDADGVLILDASDTDYLRSTLTRFAMTGVGRLRAIVILDVNMLNQAEQAALAALIEIAYSGPRPCRVITTTSVPLFDRVRQGSFDAELFYQLNKIHIAADHLMSQRERSVTSVTTVGRTEPLPATHDSSATL